MGTHHREDPEATPGNDQDIYRNLDIFDDNKIINEHALLLPDGGNIESDNEDQYLQEEDAKRLGENAKRSKEVSRSIGRCAPKPATESSTVSAQIAHISNRIESH